MNIKNIIIWTVAYAIGGILLLPVTRKFIIGDDELVMLVYLCAIAFSLVVGCIHAFLSGSLS